MPRRSVVCTFTSPGSNDGGATNSSAARSHVPCRLGSATVWSTMKDLPYWPAFDVWQSHPPVPIDKNCDPSSTD